MALLLCTHIPASRCRGAASTSSAPTGTPSRPCRVRGRAPRCAHAPIAAADRRRAGLVDVFSNDTSFEIVGQASTRGEALERAPPGTPGASSVAATVIGRCASTGGASRLGPGGRAHSPGADRLFRARRPAPSTDAPWPCQPGWRRQCRLNSGYRPRRLPGQPSTGSQLSSGSPRRDRVRWTHNVGGADAGRGRDLLIGAVCRPTPTHPPRRQHWGWRSAKSWQLSNALESLPPGPREPLGSYAAADPRGRHRRGRTA